ncbi:TRAP transporter large permease subunit [Bradyrhizobium pachyrhizi]|uniref:TRAP transporter large permease protein n=1 Tax=Bradyrhizobium pachyrhizi TaxID=280333 RepID=A0A844SGA3_9BRAD|nr:TRAP transporter large permease [Bradyrhizobium pachyrhizi]MVT64585.1 TRAP transporter large permease subunit [Bradyrhizobium pachyrhizi]
MTPGVELILVLAIFVGLLCVGMTIPFAITVPSVIYLLLHAGLAGLKGIGLVSWGSMNSFTLSAIPLFILMAEILQESRLSLRVYHGLSKLVSWIPGGLLQTNIAGCAIFAAISGSSVVTAASIGRVALPELRKRKYSPRLSAGSLAAGGTLGILIPPSIAMIVYGTFTETSVAKLFMAGVMPGLLLTAMFMTYIALHAWFKPGIAPAETGARSVRELLSALLDVIPFMVLIGGTIGSIYSGLVTPTEAAAVGCVLAMIIAMFWGDFSVAILWRALQTTVRVCGNILFIVYAAFLFSYAISYAGVGERITQFLVDLKLSKLEFFFALFVLYTVLGCLVESLGMIVVTVPLLYPVLVQYGIDPIWFGVILVLFIEMGQISPPIGINLFVIQSIWTGKLSDVVTGTIPFHLIMFVLLGLLVIFPEIAMWLPSQAAVVP